MAPNQVESLAPKWDDNVTNADKVRPEPDGVPEGLIRVENKLYSSKELAKLHPGGPLHIKVCTCSVVSAKNAHIILMMQYIINKVGSVEGWRGLDNKLKVFF